jgi:hypothetical protein
MQRGVLFLVLSVAGHAGCGVFSLSLFACFLCLFCLLVPGGCGTGKCPQIQLFQPIPGLVQSLSVLAGVGCRKIGPVWPGFPKHKM